MTIEDITQQESPELTGFILVHFHSCDTPCYIRVDEIVKFHAIDTGTCIFLANSQSIVCHESPDEIVAMLQAA